MKKALSAIAQYLLQALLVLIGIVAVTDPQDVIDHLSNWYLKITSSIAPPSWLTGSNIDDYVSLVGAVTSVVGAAAIWLTYRTKKIHQAKVTALEEQSKALDSELSAGKQAFKSALAAHQEAIETLRDKPEPPPTPAVVSINQSGGQTAHTIVNQAPKPELRQLGVTQRQNEDGSFTTTATFQVIAPYPPAELKLVARAPSIMEFTATLDRTGIVMIGHTGRRDGYCFTSIMNPSGRVIATAKTAHSETVGIEYQLE